MAARVPLTPPPEETVSVPFKVKKFDYNRYYIKYDGIKGILNLASIVVDVVEPPPNFKITNPTNETIVGIQLISVVSFTNQGTKIKPTRPPTQEDVLKGDSIDITGYIIDEEKQEHWNEYVLARSPSEILKTKTTLVRLSLVKDKDDGAGNPLFNVNHNTVHAVFRHPASEAGSR